MNYDKYKPYLQQYLQSKGYTNFNNNISCFSPSHDDQNPSMQVKDNHFKCYSGGCGISGDTYDAVEILENITGKKEQFEFIEKLMTGKVTNFSPIKKEKFIIDSESAKLVSDYMRDSRKNGEKYINYFLSKRGLTGKLKHDIGLYLGYWKGYEAALDDLGIEILKKAGIPGSL